jgi:hypothetical protein
MSGIHVNPIVRTSQDEMWYRFHNMWPVQVPMTQQMPGTPRADEGVEAAAPVTQVWPKHALRCGATARGPAGWGARGAARRCRAKTAVWPHTRCIQ